MGQCGCPPRLAVSTLPWSVTGPVRWEAAWDSAPIAGVAVPSSPGMRVAWRPDVIWGGVRRPRCECGLRDELCTSRPQDPCDPGLRDQLPRKTSRPSRKLPRHRLRQIKHEDAVPDSGRLPSPGQLECDQPAIVAHHRIRCLVAGEITEVSQPLASPAAIESEHQDTGPRPGSRPRAVASAKRRGPPNISCQAEPPAAHRTDPTPTASIARAPRRGCLVRTPAARTGGRRRWQGRAPACSHNCSFDAWIAFARAIPARAARRQPESGRKSDRRRSSPASLRGVSGVIAREPTRRECRRRNLRYARACR